MTLARTPAACPVPVDARPLAVFDLDGALTARDTFLQLLADYARKRRRLRPLLALAAYLGLYACRLHSDRAAKECERCSFSVASASSRTASLSCARPLPATCSPDSQAGPGVKSPRPACQGELEPCD
jgi:hypothetical protein